MRKYQLRGDSIAIISEEDLLDLYNKVVQSPIIYGAQIEQKQRFYRNLWA